MVASRPLHPDAILDLALAVIASSMAPLVLLDGDLAVIAASSSFYRAFQIDPASGTGQQLVLSDKRQLVSARTELAQTQLAFMRGLTATRRTPPSVFAYNALC